ncbi:MAG: hypothetical protein ACYYK0_01000 [Candidatus Eutrophobiaceae bacterium]
MKKFFLDILRRDRRKNRGLFAPLRLKNGFLVLKASQAQQRIAHLGEFGFDRLLMLDNESSNATLLGDPAISITAGVIGRFHCQCQGSHPLMRYLE